VWPDRLTGKYRSSRVTSAPLSTAAIALAMLALPVGSASAGDFFNFFFGGSRPQSSGSQMPATAYADPSTPTPFENPALRDPSGQQSGAPEVAYCVRLCDGRYFPIQRHAGNNPVQLCSGMCPASKTKIFNGTEIDHATASDGKRYADLDNAFVYRQRLVDNCTCNGKDAFGTARVDLTSDPTLRVGDIIATVDGLAKVSRVPGARKTAAFTPIDPSTQVDNMMPRDEATSRRKLASRNGTAQD